MWRYMTKEQVLSYINSQTIMSQSSTESYNLRSNVESTIHQTFHRIKKRQKIVYRRLIKCQWYVLLRVMWVNMTRISKNLQEISQFFINWSFPFPTMHHNFNHRWPTLIYLRHIYFHSSKMLTNRRLNFSISLIG